MLHWKVGGHKHECFTPDQNRQPVLIADEVTAGADAAAMYIMSHRCLQEMGGKYGILICLGRQQQQQQQLEEEDDGGGGSGPPPPFIFIKDIWQDNTKQPLVPGLHVDHVPPMLLSGRRNLPMNLVERASSHTRELCRKFLWTTILYFSTNNSS